MDEWIVVPNWDRFQHYKDRNPAWVKLYTELNRRDDWRALTYAERGLLTSIWAEYGVSNGLLRVTDIGSRLGQRVDSRALISLNRAGFIQLFASKPLALARSREKRRVEKNDPHPRKTENPAPQPEPRPAAAAYEPFSNGHAPDRDVELGLAYIRGFLDR